MNPIGFDVHDRGLRALGLVQSNSAKSVNVSGNPLISYGFLMQFAQLESLSASRCELRTLRQLSEMTLKRLKRLDISFNSLRSLDGFGEDSVLEYLDVSGNPMCVCSTHGGYVHVSSAL